MKKHQPQTLKNNSEFVSRKCCDSIDVYSEFLKAVPTLDKYATVLLYTQNLTEWLAVQLSYTSRAYDTALWKSSADLLVFVKYR